MALESIRSKLRNRLISAFLNAPRNYLEDRKWLASVKRHMSCMATSLAPMYTAYHEQCRAGFLAPVLDSKLQSVVESFDEKGFAFYNSSETQVLARSMLDRVQKEENESSEVWDDNGLYLNGEPIQRFREIEILLTGETGKILEAVFGSHFKLFFARLYKQTRRREEATGSELWHYDGGPGTCVKILFFLNDVGAENGGTEVLPWRQCLQLFAEQQAAMREILAGVDLSKKSAQEGRKYKCDWYRNEIAKRFADSVEQVEGPGGTFIIFRNTLLHKGGFPEPGEFRYTLVLSFYPSDIPTPFDHYRKFGAPKTGPYPEDPAAIWPV